MAEYGIPCMQRPPLGGRDLNKARAGLKAGELTVRGGFSVDLLRWPSQFHQAVGYGDVLALPVGPVAILDA